MTPEHDPRPPRRASDQPASHAAPIASEIPTWPKTGAFLNADGSGRLTIDGRSEELPAGDIAASRALVIERVTATAQSVGRPVRLNSSDPDGEWELAVYPDGHVEELAGRAAAPQPEARAPAPPGVPVGRATAPRTPPRGRFARRVAAALAVVVLIASGVAVVAATTDGGEDATEPVPTIAAPAIDVKAISAMIAKAKREAQQRADAQQLRRRAAEQRAAASRRAAAQRAARRREARRRAAARRRDPAAARPTRPPAPAVPQRPVSPQPPPPSDCGQFDLC